MSDLVTFLRARLDEDEAAAKAARDAKCLPWQDDEWSDQPEEWIGHYDRHGPERALREVAAGRAILRWHPSEQMRHIDASRCPQCEFTWPCPTVRCLAAVYSGHPDYQQEWKP